MIGLIAIAVVTAAAVVLVAAALAWGLQRHRGAARARADSLHGGTLRYLNQRLGGDASAGINLILDPAGRLVWSDGTLEQILARPYQELAGVGWRALGHPDDTITPVTDGRTVTRHRHADGYWVWVAWRRTRLPELRIEGVRVWDATLDRNRERIEMICQRLQREHEEQAEAPL